jgi:hypothetical protein
MVAPPENPPNFQFVQADILWLDFDLIRDWWIERGKDVQMLGEFDFVCASSPCEEFSIWGMPHFHPNPKYPHMGIKLFNRTRGACELSGTPYVMENVRPAQLFVGPPMNSCGPFYLWGSGVPPMMPQGIRKGMVMGESKLVNELKRNGDRDAIKAYRRKFDLTWNSSKSPERKEATAKAATIPPELANCVADYAENLLAMSKREFFGQTDPEAPISRDGHVENKVDDNG